MAALLLFALAALLPADSARAEVYTWVDETGQIHYSDTWVEGCRKVQMPESTAPPAPATPVARPLGDGPAPTRSPATDEGEDTDAPIYRSIDVVSPAPDECLRRIGAIVKVLVNIDPPPRKGKYLQEPGHRLLVTVDGERPESEFLIGLRDDSLVLFLTETYRGTHRLQVSIEDERGESLIQSNPVQFSVQQVSGTILGRNREQLRRQLQGPWPLPKPDPPHKPAPTPPPVPPP